MNILKNKSNYLFWLLLILPTLLVYNKLFTNNVLYGGDAPYFYNDVVGSLFSEAITWTERGNSFGGVNLALWLSPVMLIYGLLGKFLSFNNDLILKTLFLVPSLVLAYIGPYLLTRYLKLSKVTQFFTTLVFVFNTYYILLVDGGQVGVALAYGLFPLTLLFLKKLVDKTNKTNLLLALIFSFLLCAVDPRIFLVCFLTIFIWSILTKQFNFWLILLGFLLIPLNLYWLYPIIKLGTGGLGSSVSDLDLVSLINPLFLHSPHWPENLFGKISYPPFYYVVVPILILGGFLNKYKKQNLIFAILFLIFAFLSKGTTPPLGVNLSIAFRDSSKFFVPVILFAGILIGETMDQLKSYGWRVASYIVILFLVSPAIFGNLNFLLSNKKPDSGYQRIAGELSQDEGIFRTVWFTKKDPLSYESEEKPAVDSVDLVSKWPISRLNASEDVFNFLNYPQYLNWLRVMGVKYVFLNGDARNLNPDETDLKNWNTINNLIEANKELKKTDWGINIPTYEISNPYPLVYSVDKLTAVIGGGMSLAKSNPLPTLFLEDGKWDPNLLYDKNDSSLVFYFDNAKKEDLTMSLLQKYFIAPQEYTKSQWSVFGGGDYLKYKYQLLIRGYEFTDQDYSKGIAFSSKNGETISFKYKIPNDGDYVIAKRITNENNSHLIWQFEEKYLNKGNFEFTITNESNLTIFNAVAIVPKDKYQGALNLTDQLLQKFQTIEEFDDGFTVNEVNINKYGTLKYDVKSAVSGNWIIMSDNFHPLWNLKKGKIYYESFPVYSMFNAFYVDPTWDKPMIEFKGQEYFRWGLIGTVITVLLILIGCLYSIKDNNHV